MQSRCVHVPYVFRGKTLAVMKLKRLKVSHCGCDLYQKLTMA